ncbi:hypothetical protein EPO04_02740 [Patescibacteria group bacterium]|nr:MAG: hypothetical protein EPO04_02740 [Patescibacteria group bacterium]
MENKELRTELLAMRKADQSLRLQWPDKHNDPKWVERVKELDHLHTTRMKQIVEQNGWPTVSMVDKDGSEAAWLLVQHADHDLEFQLTCLDLMGKKANDVDPINIAYLTDRTLVSRGKPQIYGTQFYRPSGKGKHIPQPIQDPELVDERRAELGLHTLKEYSQVINRE